MSSTLEKKKSRTLFSLGKKGKKKEDKKGDTVEKEDKRNGVDEELQQAHHKDKEHHSKEKEHHHNKEKEKEKEKEQTPEEKLEAFIFEKKVEYADKLLKDKKVQEFDDLSRVRPSFSPFTLYYSSF